MAFPVYRKKIINADLSIYVIISDIHYLHVKTVMEQESETHAPSQYMVHT